VKRSYQLLELAQYLGAVLVGDPKHEIRALATLQNSGADSLSFIANPAYKKYLVSTQAGALLIHPDLQDEYAGNKLVTTKPYIAYARASSLFSSLRAPTAGIHPTAVIGDDCVIAETVSIGANAVIGNAVTLSEGVVIGPGCYVGDDTLIGQHTRLAANVSIYHGITIGKNCILHSGCVIGADGFGFAPDEPWFELVLHQK